MSRVLLRTTGAHPTGTSGRQSPPKSTHPRRQGSWNDCPSAPTCHWLRAVPQGRGGGQGVQHCPHADGEKSPQAQERVTSVSSKVGLCWIIPEGLEDVGRSPMAARYSFLDFLARITHTPSPPFLLPWLSFSSQQYFYLAFQYVYIYLCIYSLLPTHTLEYRPASTGLLTAVCPMLKTLPKTWHGHSKCF